MNVPQLCGNADSIAFDGTVMPFILRGTNLGHRLRPQPSLSGVATSGQRPETLHPDPIASREITLERLPEVFERMLVGDSFGRTIVRVGKVQHV